MLCFLYVKILLWGCELFKTNSWSLLMGDRMTRIFSGQLLFREKPANRVGPFHNDPSLKALVNAHHINHKSGLH